MNRDYFFNKNDLFYFSYHYSLRHIASPVFANIGFYHLVGCANYFTSKQCFRSFSEWSIQGNYLAASILNFEFYWNAAAVVCGRRSMIESCYLASNVYFLFSYLFSSCDQLGNLKRFNSELFSFVVLAAAK